MLNAHLAIRGLSADVLNEPLLRNNLLFTGSISVETLKQHVIAEKEYLKDNLLALLFILRIYVIELVNAISKRSLKEAHKG